MACLQAITVVVVSAPVLGKVTQVSSRCSFLAVQQAGAEASRLQVSFERSVGTVAGGMLGYFTVLIGYRMLVASDVLFTGVPPLSSKACSLCMPGRAGQELLAGLPVTAAAAAAAGWRIMCRGKAEMTAR